MLVKHVYQWNGKLLATFVSVDQHKVGISIVNENDDGNKDYGIAKAKYRAMYGKLLEIPNRLVRINSQCMQKDVTPVAILGNTRVVELYDLLMAELNFQEHRSVRYFSKHPVEVLV